MKFFSKYKKQIFSVFLCVALFSCFIGFSFSSSAEVVNDVSQLTVSDVYFQVNRDFSDLSVIYHLNHINDAWVFHTDLPYIEAAPIFNRLTFSFSQDYTVPSYSGRALSLSFNLDFIVSNHGYLSLVPDNVDLSDSAIFTNCFASVYFSDGSEVTLLYDSFILRDDELGEIVDPSSDAYWETRKADSPWDFSIYALFDFTPYVGKTITHIYITFPYPSGSIYYSNNDLITYLTLRDVSANIDFAYSPFQDVVQDDLSDIKGSLSGVNNKLDSISDSVNQQFEQTNETLGNIDQGIQDILKPSSPSVDFKNQWNDYFANNPIPDISNLPLYDMSNLMTLLADSSQVIRGIFSPFFLRDYQVTVPLINGFSNIKLDPVATYVSLSFALSLSILIIGILKGSRG